MRRQACIQMVLFIFYKNSSGGVHLQLLYMREAHQRGWLIGATTAYALVKVASASRAGATDIRKVWRVIAGLLP